jgi:hypothetical protein
MSEASPQVRALYRSYQSASCHVVGSPGSIRSLRSRGFAVCHTACQWQAVRMVGAMTKLNPSNLQPQIPASLAGACTTGLRSTTRPAASTQSMRMGP